MSEPVPAAEQMRLLRRGAVDLVDESELATRIEKSSRTGKPLVVKTGFDPTSPDLHLGHTVLLRKMRHFQQLGHEVIFLVGDFTAMIGDPTGKKATRPQLSSAEVEANAATYQKQAFRILDPEKTVIERNSRWLTELGSEGMIRLAGSYTLARMMERDDFRSRFESNQPISIHELLYPLVQAYDSVALQCDVELGGHDQIFNLLVGRHLMRERGLEPQNVLTVPLLVGTDGVEKMSKSVGNAIALEDSPQEMFGKTMSIPDALMWDWLLLLTDLEEAEIAGMRTAVESGELHPKEAKVTLASSIVSEFHGAAAAERSAQEFERVFKRGGAPEDIPSHETDGPCDLVVLLADSGVVKSRGEARRLITQGAVSVDGERVEDVRGSLEPRDEPYLLKVGKRRFLSVRVAAGRQDQGVETSA